MYDYIDTQEKLEKFLSDIAGYSWIAIDTEFIREKSYFSKLCLLQIATSDHLACVDPLAIKDIAALKNVLCDPAVIKVMHAAHQDQEIFYNLFGEAPHPIFDTQPAAAVLGVGDQIGYAKLIEEFLGVSLEKSQSRTDWSRRPLSDKQLDYAIDDVRYLRQAYPLIRDKLSSQGRLEWLKSDFEYYEQAETFEPKPMEMWKKVKGNQSLKPLSLTILQRLAAWREELAVAKDLPRRWIISDDILIDIALQQPENQAEIAAMRGMNEKQHARYSAVWLDCINEARQVPEAEWLRLPRWKKPTGDQAILIDLLMLAVRIQAHENNIAASMLTSRKKMEKLVMSGETELESGWRGSLINSVISEVLKGRVSFSVDADRKVRISP